MKHLENSVAALKAALNDGNLIVSEDGEILDEVPKLILALIEHWEKTREPCSQTRARDPKPRAST